MIATEKKLKKTYEIHAPVSAVWKALTDPTLIKQYFFGTEASSDWKKGSTIFYRGTWEGKSYEDKAKIIDLIPEKLLSVNYWSSRSGKPDRPENYSPHAYELDEEDGKTNLTLVQNDSYKSEESRSQAWQHWDMVVEGLKKIVE